MNKLRLLAFGIASDIVQSTEVGLELKPSVTLSEIKNELELHFPKLKEISSYRISVNHQFVNENYIPSISDELAIIPPVSGG